MSNIQNAEQQVCLHGMAWDRRCVHCEGPSTDKQVDALQAEVARLLGLRDWLNQNAAPQVAPSACQSDAGSAQAGQASPAVAARFTPPAGYALVESGLFDTITRMLNAQQMKDICAEEGRRYWAQVISSQAPDPNDAVFTLNKEGWDDFMYHMTHPKPPTPTMLAGAALMAKFAKERQARLDAPGITEYDSWCAVDFVTCTACARMGLTDSCIKQRWCEMTGHPVDPK